jgi:hypothetical protein
MSIYIYEHVASARRPVKRTKRGGTPADAGLKRRCSRLLVMGCDNRGHPETAMNPNPSFADTVFDGLMGMEPARAPHAPRAVAARRPVLTRTVVRSVALQPSPRVVAAAQPAAVRRTQPAPAGTLLLMGVVNLVLLPGACIAMLLATQITRL